ncbi:MULTISPECIES: diaminopimelate epimerase [unclassified Paracoccus (in: a-proteobacteria)]|uniref:diaminopimelate epimerase n=1 Tax=unclassified Paracoccus (in: a-proteobacteria) TaxID=2688777 RepID=UPI0012B41254|nr:MULTISPECIES: diaminopimelate epimerase [unclassified Paracoccus (in: a-proteobacteria)]UXU75496.1 diaminopimelate epimerase [Paracoccus sp. SMMA_5]UXU81401.1 diaminopimelate epimerase [Paracoccus sp. SMMA_5_TC]
MEHQQNLGQSQGLRFMKMHGLGNDFVVIDSRQSGALPDAATVAAMADRHRGVGFDQLAVILPGQNADARLVFYNADGSQSAACGNATRCVARYLMDETGAPDLRLATEHAVLQAQDAGGGQTRVNMGAPVLDWAAIPLAQELDTLHLPIAGDPVATGMGNPHMTFFVEDAAAVDLERFGPQHEHHPLYPQRANVELVQVLSPQEILLRIWERGTGITLASGSCSCAAVVAAARRGLTGRQVRVNVPGGVLDIDWRADGVWMTGPTAHVFDGVWRG